nr:MAG TPA: hypothetical protein [Caudoviricetes sp.]
MATNTDEIKKLKKEIQNFKSVKEENEELKKELEEIKKMLSNNISTNQANAPIIINDTERDVLFTSLYPGILNLSTEGNGKGEIYSFQHFGEEQNIPYSQARQIIKNNKNFIVDGFVFISDDDIIKTERLEDKYKKILDKSSLLELFEMNRKEFKNIFENMTKSQKEIIHRIVAEKINKKEDVDANIIAIINEILHCDIMAEIENGKDLEE